MSDFSLLPLHSCICFNASSAKTHLTADVAERRGSCVGELDGSIQNTEDHLLSQLQVLPNSTLPFAGCGKLNDHAERGGGREDPSRCPRQGRIHIEVGKVRILISNCSIWPACAKLTGPEFVVRVRWFLVVIQGHTKTTLCLSEWCVHSNVRFWHSRMNRNKEMCASGPKILCEERKATRQDSLQVRYLPCQASATSKPRQSKNSAISQE